MKAKRIATELASPFIVTYNWEYERKELCCSSVHHEEKEDARRFVPADVRVLIEVAIPGAPALAWLPLCASCAQAERTTARRRAA